MEEGAESWVSEELAGVDFKDGRLRGRLTKVIMALFSNPVASVKSACRGWAEVMAAYRFFRNKGAPAEKIMAAHRGRTLERARGQGRVVFVQDTSELDYSKKKNLAGSGPLSDTGRRGFFLDLGYLMGADGLPLGVWRTNLFRRKDEGFGRSREQAKRKPIEEKESLRWLEGYRDSCALAGELPSQQVVFVADREGDIYEIFEQALRYEQSGGARANWVIRKSQERACTGPGEQDDRGHTHIGEVLAGAPALGTITFRVKGKSSFKKGKGGGRARVVRKGREVTLSIASAKVSLRPPARRGKKLPALDVWVVQGVEVDAPQGQEPVEWTILTDIAAAGFEQAVDVLKTYARRWEIEVFFRVLKTGCKIEELQLKKAAAVKKAICCYLVVAWRILYLTKLGRTCPGLPCDTVFETDEWQAAWAVAHGPAALEQLGAAVPTLGEMIVLIATFGGYLNRACDEPPGAQAMWEGMRRNLDFTLAWQAFGKPAAPAAPG